MHSHTFQSSSCQKCVVCTDSGFYEITADPKLSRQTCRELLLILSKYRQALIRRLASARRQPKDTIGSKCCVDTGQPGCMWLASKRRLSGSTGAASCRQALLLCSRTLQLFSTTGKLQCLAEKQHTQLYECESIRARTGASNPQMSG